MVEVQIGDVEKQINFLIAKINASQADTLAKLIAAAYVAGSRVVTSTVYSADKKRISELQERAIKRLTAEQFGYISEFNVAVGEQIAGKARELLRQEKGYAEISEYTRKVFDSSENVIINNVGKTRKVIEIGKDGNLREVEKLITRPYTTTVDNYADMLGRTATHSAFEEGRAAGYQKLGLKFWRFVGPADERSRDRHVAVLGNVYEYGTEQSDLALRLLHEPNCRHRQIVFFNDEELDSPAELFEEQKKKAGLRWDDETGKWTFNKASKPKPTIPKKTKKEKLAAEKLEEIIREHESTIKNKSYENSFVFDDAGNVLFTKSGSKNQISFTAEESKVFKGAIFTHNHPQSSSFSPADIRTACGTGLKEVRATGSQRTYVMRMTDGSEFNKELWNNRVDFLSEQYNADVRSEFYDMIAKGELSPEDAQFLHWHEVWSRVVKDIPELQYTVIEEP